MSEDIDIGQFSEAINHKADLDLNNTNPFADYVIESKYPTADDPTWYRLYKSGWIEQGGYITNVSTSGYTTITLIKEMSDVNYYVSAINTALSDSYNGTYTVCVGVYTTTSFGIRMSSNSSTAQWEVKGMSAR